MSTSSWMRKPRDDRGVVGVPGETEASCSREVGVITERSPRILQLKCAWRRQYHRQNEGEAGRLNAV